MNRPGQSDPTPAPFVEGAHFYFENGLMVLTAKYLLDRGYCCGNGCRHCPYDDGGKPPPLERPADPPS
jgi:Family of unknown function (DUF5522)